MNDDAHRQGVLSRSCELKHPEEFLTRVIPIAVSRRWFIGIRHNAKQGARPLPVQRKSHKLFCLRRLTKSLTPIEWHCDSFYSKSDSANALGLARVKAVEIYVP